MADETSRDGRPTAQRGPGGVAVHHPALLPLLRETTTQADLDVLEAQLRGWGVFDFPQLETGLYSAVVGDGADETGYRSTWLRDTVHVANVRWDLGETGSVAATCAGLLRWLQVQAPRFEACLSGEAELADPMQRPHVRFDGERMVELDAWWPHAQNDALGITLWLLCRAVLSRLAEPSPELADVLARFPLFFEAVDYCHDAESGHWEETPKRNASSVGAVVAGLRSLRGLLRADVARPLLERLAARGVDDARLAGLLGAGRRRLAESLPLESTGNADPRLDRAADAACLFLVHPLWVAEPSQAGRIVGLVREHLMGRHGIRRYVGDSYWSADYKRRFTVEERSGSFEGDLTERDSALVPGSEAQWCLFDPVLSCIHGRRAQATGSAADLLAQRLHFHRALGQITGPDGAFPEGLCPEAYVMPDSATPGHWEPNDDTPLMWTQAMLVAAFQAMRATAP